MFWKKKRVVRQGDRGNGNEKIDFWRITAQGLHMGLTKQEIEHLYMGEYMDLFDAYKEIHNMEVRKMLYVIPDRTDEPVSMLNM